VSIGCGPFLFDIVQRLFPGCNIKKQEDYENRGMRSSNTARYFEDHCLDSWNASMAVDGRVCKQVPKVCNKVYTDLAQGVADALGRDQPWVGVGAAR